MRVATSHVPAQVNRHHAQQPWLRYGRSIPYFKLFCKAKRGNCGISFESEDKSAMQVINHTCIALFTALERKEDTENLRSFVSTPTIKNNLKRGTYL